MVFIKELLLVITFPAFSACRFIEASCSKRLLIRIDIQLSRLPQRLEMRYVVDRENGEEDEKREKRRDVSITAQLHLHLGQAGALGSPSPHFPTKQAWPRVLPSPNLTP
jgi:hypothetical protein